MTPEKINPLPFKKELLSVIKEFDNWWLENGTTIERPYSDRPVLTNPSVSDFMEWLEAEVQKEEK